MTSQQIKLAEMKAYRLILLRDAHKARMGRKRVSHITAKLGPLTARIAAMEAENA